MIRSHLNHEFGEMLGHWKFSFPYNCISLQKKSPSLKIQGVCFILIFKNDYKTVSSPIPISKIQYTTYFFAFCDCKIDYITAKTKVGTRILYCIITPAPAQIHNTQEVLFSYALICLVPTGTHLKVARATIGKHDKEKF